MKALPLMLLLAGCAAQPNLETGEGCWRYGVLESGNTGRMGENAEVVALDYDALQKACGWVSVRACYVPRTNTIYVYKADLGDYYTNHERCHMALGKKHNNCTGYGIGKDESACS